VDASDLLKAATETMELDLAELLGPYSAAVTESAAPRAVRPPPRREKGRAGDSG